MISKVESALREVTVFRDLDQFQWRTISGGSSLKHRNFAIAALTHLSKGNAATCIVDGLTDLVTSDAISHFYLAGIGGIALPKKMQLTPTTSLVTKDDVSPSWAREFVFRFGEDDRHVGDPGHEAIPPRAALRVDHRQPVLVSGKTDLEKRYRLDMSSLYDAEEQIFTCIALASNDAAPVITARTSWIDHPLQTYRGIAGGSGGTSPGHPKSSRYASFDSDLMLEFLRLFNQLDEPNRRRLLLATRWLRRSRLHEAPVDRILDLGIALEVLLLRDSNQELKYRAAVRGAALIGQSAAEKRSAYDDLRKIYDVRSSAVHTGEISKQKDIDVVEVADLRCRDIASRILINGGFPDDWDALVLGA